jgi:hypothetical protein
MGEIDFFISKYFKKLWKSFLFKLSKLVKSKSPKYIKEYCVFTLKGNYMKTNKKSNDLDGLKPTKELQAFAFCFDENVDATITNKFIKDFTKFYSNALRSVSNPLDLQRFSSTDLKRVRYYTTDIDYIDQRKGVGFMNAWISINNEGFVFTEKNVT